MKPPARLVRIGEQCSKQLALSEDNIRSFATRVEDFNPLHHDAAYAAQTRFGGLIASGTQPIAHFTAMLANHFDGARQPLGLEFGMKLKKAAYAGDTLSMRWEITEAHWKDSLQGDLVTLRGEVRNQHGEIVVLGSATVLVMPKAGQDGTTLNHPADTPQPDAP
jgi:acyl dehydratase